MAISAAQRLANMRLNAEEKWELFEALAQEVTPKVTQEIGLLAYADLFEEANTIAAKGSKFDGLSTGYQSIDKMTMGINGGDLIVLYGYTSMGKSQLGQNIALNVAVAGDPVLFVGLELTNVQNEARMIRMGGTDPNLPFLFPEKADVKYTELQPIIDKAVKDYGTKLVVIDQLQDLIHSTTNEQGEIGQIMAELKRAAIANDVPIIVMSHVNRTGADPGPPPLSVLKGSSSIEQKADIAIAVYQDKEAQEGEVGHKEMQVALRKNRQKGMAFTFTTLNIHDNMRLTETLTTASMI